MRLPSSRNPGPNTLLSEASTLAKSAYIEEVDAAMLALFRNRRTSILVPKPVAGSAAPDTQVVQDFLEPSENETELQTTEQEEAEL